MADCNIIVMWCELYHVWLRNSTHEVNVENRQVILWTGRTSFLLLLTGFSFHTFSREFCKFVFRRNIQRFSFQQVSGIQWFDFQKMKLTHSLSLFTLSPPPPPPPLHIMCLNVCNCFKERLPDMHSCLNLYPYVSIPPPPPVSLFLSQSKYATTFLFKYLFLSFPARNMWIHETREYLKHPTTTRTARSMSLVEVFTRTRKL